MVIAPQRDRNITWLERSFNSIHGEVRVRYEGEDLTVIIPPNSTATVLWNGNKYEIGSGSYQFK